MGLSQQTGISDQASDIAALLKGCIDQIPENLPARGRGDAELLLTLAERCQDNKKHDAAIELYDEAICCDNLSERAFAGMAFAHFSLNNFGVALTYLKQAANLQQMLGEGRQDADYEPALAYLNKMISAPPVDDAVQVQPLQQRCYHRYVNKHPPHKNFDDGEEFKKFFLSGLIPPYPFISKDHNIATIGSCFATNVARYLDKRGFLANKTNNNECQYDNVYIDDEFFNTYVIREAFEMAFKAGFDSPNWVAGEAEKAKDHADRAILYNKEHIEMLLGDADVYIITLGLAEIWYDKQDGTVFPSGLNIDKYDEARHGFRLSSTEENLENLESIHALIRAHRPGASIIFTLSPVPLLATFRPINCVAANSASKAVLRVAIDQLCQAHENDDQLFYFPSYEIVKDHFADAFEEDGRHVTDYVVDFIMDRFSESFLTE
ncbi:MAG: GSCFA domain-containing protein [Rhodospirillales bacterium]|nr:GSCFA domain-containing protein [Rhodospirillales bacterium]